MLVGSKWKPVGVTKFRTKVEGFLGKLLVLIHITGGGPRSYWRRGLLSKPSIS
jgi:hypothetical protein